MEKIRQKMEKWGKLGKYEAKMRQKNRKNQAKIKAIYYMQFMFFMGGEFKCL
jgi:hypothetical protein